MGEWTDVTAVSVAGDDRLTITGTWTDDEGSQTPVTADGWLSATTNYYPDDTRDADGHRDADAQAREMTRDERRAYCLALLDAQLALLQPPPAPQLLDI